RQFAQTVLAVLQALPKLSGGASPLGLGTVFELRADDAILQQARESVNDVYVLANSGDSPALFRERMDVVRRYDTLAGAVLELSGRLDWIRIDKSVSVHRR